MEVARYTIQDEVAWRLRFARKHDWKPYEKGFPDYATMERFLKNEPDIVVISTKTATLTEDRGALL